MSKRAEGQVWARAKALARSLSPAGEWRERLAATLLEVPDVVSSWVFTCPPGFPFAARGIVLPENAGRAVADLFLKRFVPTVERDELSARMAKRLGVKPYGGFEHVDPALAARARRELLAPIGAIDAIHAFLVVEKHQVVGWVSLCTRIPARAMLERAGAELGEVSRLVSRSLSQALRVAEDCGARAPRFDSVPNRPLSERETQVAQLVGQGLSDLNIAHRLRISEHTVAAHLRSVFHKLKLHGRAELAARAPLLRGAGFQGRNPGGAETHSR